MSESSFDIQVAPNASFQVVSDHRLPEERGLKRVYTSTEKHLIMSEYSSGKTAIEVSQKYGIRLHFQYCKG